MNVANILAANNHLIHTNPKSISNFYQNDLAKDECEDTAINIMYHSLVTKL